MNDGIILVGSIFLAIGIAIIIYINITEKKEKKLQN